MNDFVTTPHEKNYLAKTQRTQGKLKMENEKKRNQKARREKIINDFLTLRS